MSRPPQLRTLRLTMEYEGGAFCGFQKQPGRLTVQSALEDAMRSLFNRAVRIGAASGRTDSGVHALGQVVHIKVATSLSCNRIRQGLNFYLPPEAAVRQVRNAAHDFHARYSAAAKTYEYCIWNHPVRSPVRSRLFLHVPQPLSLKGMREAAGILTGRHDFSSFCTESGRPEPFDKVRTVKKISVSKRGCEIRIRMTADGFLYRMARNITGALVRAGTGKLDAAGLKKILSARSRPAAPRAAAAHGLTLLSVSYSG